MTTLPTGIPKLDALVWRAVHQHQADLRVAMLDAGIATHPVFVAALETLLRNLTRPESMDWAARALAGLVGVEVGDTAPSFYRVWQGGYRLAVMRIGDPCRPDGWVEHDFEGEQYEIDDLAEALALALAAVCRDG